MRWSSVFWLLTSGSFRLNVQPFPNARRIFSTTRFLPSYFILLPCGGSCSQIRTTRRPASAGLTHRTKDGVLRERVCLKRLGGLDLFEKRDEFVARHLDIFQDSVHKARSNCLARMHRHHGTAAIGMLKEVVAALDPDNPKPSLAQCCNDLTTAKSGQLAHAYTVIRCTPTNSPRGPRSASTSRQSSIASRIRFINASSDLACVWHPRSSGTEAT